jgi:hypothetical protein
LAVRFVEHGSVLDLKVRRNGIATPCRAFCRKHASDRFEVVFEDQRTDEVEEHGLAA